MNFSRFPGFFPAGKIFFNLICVFGENVYFTEKFRYTCIHGTTCVNIATFFAGSLPSFHAHFRYWRWILPPKRWSSTIPCMSNATKIRQTTRGLHQNHRFHSWSSQKMGWKRNSGRVGRGSTCNHWREKIKWDSERARTLVTRTHHSTSPPISWTGSGINCASTVSLSTRGALLNMSSSINCSPETVLIFCYIIF